MISLKTHNMNPSANPNLPILPPVLCVATLGAVSPAAPKPLFRAPHVSRFARQTS